MCVFVCVSARMLCLCARTRVCAFVSSQTCIQITHSCISELYEISEQQQRILWSRSPCKQKLYVSRMLWSRSPCKQKLYVSRILWSRSPCKQKLYVSRILWSRSPCKQKLYVSRILWSRSPCKQKLYVSRILWSRSPCKQKLYVSRVTASLVSSRSKQSHFHQIPSEDWLWHRWASLS